MDSSFRVCEFNDINCYRLWNRIRMQLKKVESFNCQNIGVCLKLLPKCFSKYFGTLIGPRYSIFNNCYIHLAQCLIFKRRHICSVSSRCHINQMLQAHNWWYIWENKKILYIEFEKKNEFLSHLELLPFNCWNQKGRGRWKGRGHQLAWGVASNFTRLTIIYTTAKFSQVLPYSICYKYFNVPTVARQLLTIGLWPKKGHFDH